MDRGGRSQRRKLSILRREGIRQLSGICWYPAKGTAFAVNQGGTADKGNLFVLDGSNGSVKDFFVAFRLNKTPGSTRGG